jgi:hypothetical protein
MVGAAVLVAAFTAIGWGGVIVAARLYRVGQAARKRERPSAGA